MQNVYGQPYMIGGNHMAYSKAGQKATDKWVKENYDIIHVKLPKGEKDKIKAYAAAQGKSLNGLMKELIQNELHKEK